MPLFQQHFAGAPCFLRHQLINAFDTAHSDEMLLIRSCYDHFTLTVTDTSLRGY